MNVHGPGVRHDEPGKDSPAAPLLDLLRSYEQRFTNLAAISQETSTSRQSTMNWYVAISGYAMFNVRPLLEQVSASVSLGHVLGLVAVWFVACTVALAAHYLLLHQRGREQELVIAKDILINATALDLARGRADPEVVSAIINDENPELRKARARLHPMAKSAGIATDVATALLAIAFLASAYALFRQ